MKKMIYLLLFVCASKALFSQSNVGIGTTNPDASALLDVNSSNKGILFPRVFLTNINAPAPVSAPTTGLLIWNTNTDVTGGSGIGYYFWNVTKWEKLSGSLSNLWITDPTGIHNQSGYVGIGTNSSFQTALSLRQITTNGGGNAVLDMTSSDTWHTILRFRNETMNQEWQMMVAGSGNIDQQPGTFGLFNTTQDQWPFVVDRNTTNVAIGSYDHHSQIPRARLHVFNGDIKVEDIGKGIIMKSPDGQCWRVTVSNTGSFVSTAIPCL